MNERQNQVFRDLEADPFQPQLHLHSLHGQLRGYLAATTDYSHRLVLVLMVEEQVIRLVDLGTHEEVYR